MGWWKKLLDYRIHFGTKFGIARTFTTLGPDGNPIRVLQVDGVYQSATYLDEFRFDAPFSYLRSFETMFEAGISIRRVLMLGGGGFAYPKHLLSHHKNVAIDVVEIDPAIVAIARKRFFLRELEERYGNRIRIIIEDAKTLLRTHGESYDVIINDLFKGVKPESFFFTARGLQLIRKHLRAGGLYLANVVAADTPEGIQSLWNIVCTAQRIFPNVQLIPAVEQGYTALDNYLLIATDGSYHFEGTIEIDCR